jgi:hypothetical protein
MEVRQLVTSPSVLHASSALHFVSLLVNQKTFIRHDSADLIFFLFATYEKDFVLSLD